MDQNIQLNRGDIKYIKFEILQIVSPFEDVKFSNVRGLYLRKYGTYTFVLSKRHPHSKQTKKMGAVAQLLVFIHLGLHMDSVICTKCATEEKVLWDKKENFMPLSWPRLITQCARFFFLFVFQPTVHIKNWDTPKKLFVKWLFVRHIQCQGTTRYYMWCSTIQ